MPDITEEYDGENKRNGKIRVCDHIPLLMMDGI
jgi:hypothetical protein